MTWDQERELVLYKLDEIKKAADADRLVLNSINSKLIQYQSSVRTLKWVAGVVGAVTAFIADFLYRIVIPKG